MKKWMLLLLFPSFAFANGPKYTYKSSSSPPGLNDEMQNIYHDIANIQGTIPSGMIAMFDASCPTGWTRFAALDNAFPFGGAAYGSTGGAASVTLSVAQLPAHHHTITDPGHSHLFGGNSPSISVDNTGSTRVALFSGSNGQSTTNNATGITQTNDAGSGNSVSILPTYVTVIWCKKN